MRYCRPFLILLLCLPQVFAPLVHAHLGEEPANTAFHIPGLEAWNTAQTFFLPANSLGCEKGIVVGLSQGVLSKATSSKQPPSLPPSLFPAGLAFYAEGVCQSSQSVFSPVEYSSKALPRAPPA